jgi:hypothetical protein
MTSLVLDFPLGPQKTAPDAKFLNPANFVNQLAFLARVFLIIPHRAILCFPARINSKREGGNGKEGQRSSYRRHQVNLLILKIHAASEIPGQRFLWFIAFRLPIRGVGAGRDNFAGARVTACVQAHCAVLKKIWYCSFRTPGKALTES